MKFISTRKNTERVSFKEAVINGLTANGGLYFPESIPKLPTSFFKNIESYSDNDIAFNVLKPFVKDSMNDTQLKNIIAETLSFPMPITAIDNSVYALELFHGPTQAFKDVGARFMSRCLSYFYTNTNQKVNILVATSGDTGSAVANGFYAVPNVYVNILFPKGKVSPYQEFQMTSLGKNISAIEVEGVFDDCQRLVKEAFSDPLLKENLTMSSANSINVARLLPQMLYYFFAYKQLKAQLGNKKLIISVPSGNLGNITAGLIAQCMGLPITHFVAALNANDTFLHYLKSGEYQQKPSVETYSNAMDVGSPSNFERIAYLFEHNVDRVKHAVSSYSLTDRETLQEIERCYHQHNYLLDPHGAVGKLALSKFIDQDAIGVFLGTAHPEKFSDVIQKVLPTVSIKKVDLSHCRKLTMQNSFSDLKTLLLNRAASI